MPLSRVRGLLLAACLPLLAAGCGGERPSTLVAPAEPLAAAAKRVQITLVSGGGQSGAPGQPLATPILVRVTDAAGQPMADWPITFDPGLNADADARLRRTDRNGYATTLWTLGPEVGTQTMRVSGTGASLAIPASAVRGDGTRVGLVKRRGEEQTAAAGARLPAAIQTLVVRDDGRPVVGAIVTYTASGGGRVNLPTVRTGADGIGFVLWVLGPGGGEQTLTASVPSAPPVTYTATATGGTQRSARVGLVLQPDSLVLDVGETGAFTASLDNPGQPQLPGQAPRWWTSNPAVATVDDQGRVRGVAAGTAVITATLGSHVAFATVHVRGPVPALLQLSPDSLVLDAGAEGVLTAVVRTAAGAPIPGMAPVWSSSAPGVVMVDATGRVRGVATGTARVTATLGTLSASAIVRVRGPASLQVVPDSLVLDVGATGRLSAIVRDASGAQLPGGAPVWSSSAPGVATVDAQGNVRGVGAGTARVTATLGALTASATVRVRAAGPSLELYPDSLVLDIGVRARVFPVVRDASGRAILDYRLEWTSSNDYQVFVFSDGTLVPYREGRAVITARLGNLTASIPVRVRPPTAPLTITQTQKRVSATGGIIDPATRDVELNWWIHVSQGNVSALSMRVRSPSGRTIDCRNAGPTSHHRIEFSCQLYLPRGSEPGMWEIDRITVTKDGQTTTFSSADLAAMGTLGRRFSVYGAGTDTQPPRVGTVWPYAGGRQADLYYVQIGLVDHVSGVRGGRATFRGPGGVTHTCEISQSYGPLARAGGGLCRLPARPGSGAWELLTVEVEDGAGNRATYTARQIAEMTDGVSEEPFMVYTFYP